MTSQEIAERDQAREQYVQRLETICRRYDSEPDRSRTLGTTETWPTKSHSKEDFDH